MSVEDVFGGLRINGQDWLHIVMQILQPDAIPFDSNAPNAAAYACKVWLSIKTRPALDVFFFFSSFLQPA